MINLKSIVLIALVTLRQLCAKAQQDTLVYYIDKKGQFLDDKTAAEKVRVVLRDRNQKYRVVKDFYKNGKLEMLAQSTRDDGNFPTGPIIEYFENGKRKLYSVIEQDGFLKSYINYYPNGKQAMTVHCKYDGGAFIDELRDTSGVVLINEGEGKGVFYFTKLEQPFLLQSDIDWTIDGQTVSNNFPLIKDVGPVKKGKRNGVWYRIRKTDTIAAVTYDNGSMISGTGYDSLKNPYTFKTLYQPSLLNDEYQDISEYVTSKINMKTVKKEAINGTIFLEYDVEADGTVDHVELKQGVAKSLDDQAINIIQSTSNHWQPSKKFGIPQKDHKRCFVRIKT